MKEQQIQKKIINYLEDMGAYVIKTINSNRSGIPDIICCLDGKFIAIEVKRIGGKTTPLQEYELSKINKAGGKAKVIYSIEALKSFLRDELTQGKG